MLYYHNNNKIKCIIVHCKWGPWDVTDCDKTCGGGTKTKTRKIAQQAEHDGNECTGDSTITESCNIQECPSNKDIINTDLLYFI